jgi:hypothetical protein
LTNKPRRLRPARLPGQCCKEHSAHSADWLAASHRKAAQARDLERLAAQNGKDIFVPVAQAADDEGDIVTKAAQGFDKDVLPVVPGVSSQIKGQSRRAMDTVREMASRCRRPHWQHYAGGGGAEPTGESQTFGELFFYRLVTGVTADGSCVTLKPLFLLASPRGFEPLLPP